MNHGFPIAHLLATPGTAVPAVMTRARAVNTKWIAYARDRWVVTSVSVTAGIAIVGAVVGFAWFAARTARPGNSAVCGTRFVVRPGSISDPARDASRWFSRTDPITPVPNDATDAARRRRGRDRTVARPSLYAARCATAHAAHSPANTPNLAGQYPVVIYKQLLDFKTGARASAVIVPLVADLSDTDMRDLAAYYAYLPRSSGDHAAEGGPPRIVADGAPMRSIAPRTAPATVSLPARPARRGSRGSPQSTCTRSSHFSSPVPGATTSASRCATLHAE